MSKRSCCALLKGMTQQWMYATLTVCMFATCCCCRTCLAVWQQSLMEAPVLVVWKAQCWMGCGAPQWCCALGVLHLSFWGCVQTCRDCR